MNKNAIKKLMIAAIACIALCGTTLAAPAPRGQKAPTRAPQVQKAHTPARAPQTAHKPAPAPHKGVVAKPMPKPAPQVAHHRAPFRHAAPRTTLAAADAVGYAQSICPATPCHRHHRHECQDCHYDHDGWVEVGAGIIGGIIGALIAG